MSLVRVVAVVIVGVGIVDGCTCAPALPSPPLQCSVVTGDGCLPDEICVDPGVCAPVGRCDEDSDCPSIAFRCVFPAQFCALRPGFGEECSATAPCDAGNYCSLGRCRPVTDQPCATRLDCFPGFMCDKVSSFCVEEAPCTFVNQGYPETECDAEETCDASGVCRAACQGFCTPETEQQDCGVNRRCDGACRCVDCLTSNDCGAGLICNRNGRCQSENLCLSNNDCASPLECNPRSALCELPPPPCDDDFDCQIAEICNLVTARCELPGGVCFDDRFEDADTPATAESLPVLIDVPKLFDELVLCPDDDDVYVFDLRAGDRLFAAVTGTAVAARATVWLLHSDAETSVAFSETPPRGSGEVVYTAQVDESVYLRVNALLAQTTYDLTVEIVGGSTCQPDFFEGGSGNDTTATAVNPAFLAFGVPMSAEICFRDTDIYAVDLQPGHGVRATVAFDGARSDLDVAILDSAGAVLRNSAGTGQPEVVEQRVQAGGRVYVRVRGFGNSNGPYTMTLERLLPVGCTDTLEPDDDTPRLVVVPNVDGALGAVPLVEERGLCAGGALNDSDRWAIAVEEFERIVAVAVTADPGLRMSLAIENETGAVLKTSAIGQGGAAVSFDATATGTLHVRAFSQGGQIGNYTIRLSKENQDGCPQDALEPNNTPATRSALPAPTDVVTICESDEDFYVLSGTAGKKAVIDVTFAHGDGDLDVQLLGLDGVQILGTADSLTDNEHLEVLLPLDSDYTIRVFSLSSGARSRYFLSTTVETPN